MIEPRMRPSDCRSSAFLGLERGLQAVGPMAIGDDPARELVDHADAAVPDDVVDVAPQERVRVQRAIELGQQRRGCSARAGCRSRAPARPARCPASVSSTSRPYSSVS